MKHERGRSDGSGTLEFAIIDTVDHLVSQPEGMNAEYKEPSD